METVTDDVAYCPVCGAYWQCEHRPAVSEVRMASIESLANVRRARVFIKGREVEVQA